MSNQITNLPINHAPDKLRNEQPVFEYLRYKYGDFPESEKASRVVLSLPMHPFLEKSEQDEILNKLKTLIK